MDTDIEVKDSEKEQANQSSKLKEAKKNKSLSKIDKANKIVWIAVFIMFTVSFVSAYIYANDIELSWDSLSKTYRKIDDRVY